LLQAASPRAATIRSTLGRRVIPGGVLFVVWLD
jgi:hypothetical protein